MIGQLHPRDDALLRKLCKEWPRPQWFTETIETSVERLLDIGFIQRTRNGVVITPAGISYCMLSSQIKALKAGTSQMSLFSENGSETSNQLQLNIWE